MKKILIVDDDDELRSNLSEILRGKGYQTDEAPSGKDAIEKATSIDFDIVLLDLMMPKISGMDVLVELRKSKPRTKIIMITAFATVDNAVDAIKKGASDYISKPFKIEHLDVTIRRVLEEARFDVNTKKWGLDNTLGCLSNSIRREIIKLLSLHKEMNLIEITRALDIEDHTKTLFHLRTLKDSRLIERAKGKTYSLTQEGKEIHNYLKILESHLPK